MYDLKIEGTRVIDGTGDPWWYGDIAVLDGRIVAMGRSLSSDAHTTIDGRGFVACPGFIDFHAHSDLSLLVNPRGESAVRQGITTQINGNCGFSPAPLGPEDAANLARIPTYADLTEHILYGWRTMAEYLDLLRDQGLAINFATMVGNSNLRRTVLGQDERSPNAEEMTRMKRILYQALEEGGWGLSTGLSFVPDYYSTTKDLIALSEVLQQHRRVYATHMRNYSTGLMESTGEAIRIGEEAGIPIDIAHFSGYGREHWGKIPQAIALVEAARERGVDVAFDNPPVYTRGSSGGGGLNLLPPWALEGGTEKMLERMRDPTLSDRAKRDVEQGGWQNWINFRWNDTLLTKASTPANQTYVGLTVTEIAAQRGEAPIDTVFNLLLEEKGQFHMAPVVKSREDIDYVVKHPLCKLSSDGEALAPYGPLAGCDHARSYGTFPRLLGRFVRERGVLPLEDAIRKMTSAPAARLGLTDRGLLREGLAADISVFDPNTVIDQADWQNPEAYPLGIEWVLVNGEIVIQDGKHTGALPGRVLVPDEGR